MESMCRDDGGCKKGLGLRLGLEKGDIHVHCTLYRDGGS